MIWLASGQISRDDISKIQMGTKRKTLRKEVLRGQATMMTALRHKVRDNQYYVFYHNGQQLGWQRS